MIAQLRILMFAVISLACLRPCLAQQSPPAASPDGTIEQSISDLGSPSYLVRERASQQLWNAGIEAQGALEKAAVESDDFEVVARARQLVAMFHLGIYPDTPREIVAQIGNFRMGTYTVKRQIAQELLNSGKLDLARRLIELEPNRRAREQLGRLVLPMIIEGAADSAFAQSDMGLAVRVRLAQRNFTSAERMLRDSTSDDLTRDYAALLLGRGKLDAAITQLRAKLGPGDQKLERRLAWMLRAKGDLTGSLAAAKAAKDDALVEALRVESGDWNELARHEANVDVTKLADSLAAPQKLARIITFRQLAGDKAASDAAVKEAVSRWKRQPQANRKLLDALILNDRADQVLAACGAQEPTIAFDLLASQNRLQDAFRLVKIPVKFDVLPAAAFDWNAWLKDGGAVVTPDRRILAHHVLRALYRVGADERAAELVTAMLGVVKEHVGDALWQQEAQFLIDVAALSARPETCDEMAARVLARKLDESDRVVSALYSQQTPIASLVWTALRKRIPAEDQTTALKHLRRLLTPNSRNAKAAEEFVALLPLIEAELPSFNPSAPGEASADGRAAKLLALAALLHRYGQAKPSAKYLDRISPADVSSQILIEQGDLYAEEKQWNEAIRAYDAAWTKDRRSASALYLVGWAQSKHGDDTQGRRQMELALLIPLGDGDSRRTLARTLARLHADDEAARQRQLVLRLAAPHNSSVVQALDEMCDTAAANAEKSDKAQMSNEAQLSQRLAAEFLLTSSVFLTETRFYFQWRAVAHRFAARQLLRAGRTTEAIEEIHRAEAVMAEDVQIALDCDADLRKQGAAVEADALYRRLANRLQADCRAFPRYATCRNDLAWLAANLDRDLDMALANAQRAVELAPQSAGILDTLAEVQFRRGNRAAAIQLARRCIELDGDGRLFKERLARFEK